jgi:hypothetical protein
LEPTLPTLSRDSKRLKWNWNVPKPRVWAGAIIAGFLIWNLANLHDYGLSYDEPIGMRRGEETTGLFRAFLTGSEPEYNLTYATYQLYPSFYAFLNYQCAEFLKDRGMDPIAAGHILNLLTGTFGLVVLFLFASRLYGERAGAWAVLFLALFPRFAAHAHYNAKDLPVMVFSLLTLYLLYLAYGSRKNILWAAAGISFGLSINAKLDALLIIPVFVGGWAIHWVQDRSYPLKQALVHAGMLLYCALVTLFLLWPLLWLDPLLLFKAVNHFSGTFNYFQVSYMGGLYPINEMPWHYMSVHLMAVTPLPMLMFSVIGLGLIFRQIRSKEQTLAAALLLLLLLLPLLIRLFPGALQYGGMRHVFLVVPVLAVAAGLGFCWILDHMRRFRCGSLLSFASIAVVVGWLSWQNFQVHPHQGSYLNEGVRAALPPEKLADYFDFHAWSTPLHHGVKWLNANAPEGATVHVPNQRYLVMHYRLRSDLIVTESGPADFIMFPIWRKDLSAKLRNPPVYAVQCYGADLLLIHSPAPADE